MTKEYPNCPVEMTLQLTGDSWKALIIRELLHGTMRFSQLQRAVGKITQKVLTSNLRTMEINGLLTRKVYAEVPPRVEYTLTDTGKSLKPVLKAMEIWGNL
ncbi:MarR family transcriptional regulator [endosymbiont 'TC1' of Trimyema compressum]|uniref:winged helix-turn-helix transcriptional regulator n=1 Tax=endosymbiont 'TC1' of Trimyema compressum TaxID=243899 RepID=UPI0007F0BDE6|nr:helix-turn-helix domain-containing protein [endosymbiont 'TC1' of Trimyema compressum]AMP19983.1 MarR family transcriptional regulator [endosymbiont 'TC1' of Trimyema compressum]